MVPGAKPKRSRVLVRVLARVRVRARVRARVRVGVTLLHVTNFMLH